MPTCSPDWAPLSSDDAVLQGEGRDPLPTEGILQKDCRARGVFTASPLVMLPEASGEASQGGWLRGRGFGSDGSEFNLILPLTSCATWTSYLTSLRFALPPSNQG